MFEVEPNVSFPELERAHLAFWREQRVFERSLERTRDGKPFVFYEGPPTANGQPHWGSVFTRVSKDVFLRYHTMRGRYVPRREGWDTHGLPVEVEVEKELGLKGKADIEQYGIEAFTRKCVQSVWRYIDAWHAMSQRIGFWLDTDGYATYHTYYVESVWWALKTLFDQGLLYQDYKSIWWWPQGNTALSAGEVGEGYRAVDDPSVVVRFKTADGRSLLAWTTTPWTLPSNVALAVNAAETYAEVARDGDAFVLARALVETHFGEDADEGGWKIVREFPGRELDGLAYEPLYDWGDPGGKAHVVGCGDFVTLDSGTGIVHVAPAFGEDDNRYGKEHGLGFLQLVEPDGRFSADCGFVAGMNFKEADKPLIRDLKERGLLFSQATYRHEYPFCPRAPDDPLIQYARKSWFVRTSTEKERVLANNAQVRWQPEHIRDGRMGDFLRNNVDWALSRERWWGTPLPIWKNDETGSMEAVGSVAEILERNPDAFAAFERARESEPDLADDLRVHKPWIDEVTWTRDGEPGTYRRVPEVIDCWFDAGSMPFAQWGYPHRGKAEFEAAFPADFVTEAIDQTRGWWNAMLQISTLLFPDRETPHPFRSCVVLGFITDREGKKQSKRLRNYEPPMEALEKYSADAVRWALLSNTAPGLGAKFDGPIAKEAVRDLLLKAWNVYAFFATYARIDGWDPQAARPPVAERTTLDRWILAEVDATARDVHAAFERLESHTAARRLQALVDGLSNWYVRRSRPRFWTEGDSADKHAAFSTLYEALRDVAVMLAPFTPFLSETLFQRLGAGGPDADGAAPSVHLERYPEARDELADDALRASMAAVRDLVALGLQVRNVEKLKVRQPLAEAILVLGDPGRVKGYTDMFADELNVKRVTLSDEPRRYVEYEVVPNFRALGPKLGKRMPACKQALAQADGSALHAQLEQTGTIRLEAKDGLPGRSSEEAQDGDAFELTRDDVEIRLRAKQGFSAASHGDRVVVLDTRVTEALKREGLAREVVHHLQAARKKRDLPYEARIEVTWQTDAPDLAAAIEEHENYIARETLARKMTRATPGDDAHEAVIEAANLTFSIRVTG